MSPAASHAVTLIAREAARFRLAVDDLLELGRLDTGAAALRREDTSVASLVMRALDVRGRSDDVTVDVDTDSVCFLDRRAMSRALANLFDNADRHGGGLVGASVTRDFGMAVIIVDDEGAGIEAADRERVFERFYRAGSRRSSPGTGLGLSVVKETVLAHGGTVRCTNRPGGGTRFIITLRTDERRPPT